MTSSRGVLAGDVTSGGQCLTMESEGRGGGSVEILVKTKAVIETLAEDGPSNVSHIAQRCGEPVSSTYRLLKSLSSLGWVDRGPVRGTYRLGVYFIRVGGLVEVRLDLQRLAEPILDRLCEQVSAPACLFVRRGLRAVCISMAEEEAIRRFTLRVGDSLPLNSGAPATIFVSFLPKAEKRVVFEQLRLQSPELRSLKVAEAEPGADATSTWPGFAVDVGETAPGVATIAAPVFNHRGELEATICVSGLGREIADHAESATVTARTVAAAKRLSRALGNAG